MSDQLIERLAVVAELQREAIVALQQTTRSYWSTPIYWKFLREIKRLDLTAVLELVQRLRKENELLAEAVGSIDMLDRGTADDTFFREETRKILSNFEWLNDNHDKYRTQVEVLMSMAEELEAKNAEIERLKSGAFTEEEFQNLCHDRYPCSRAEFEDGCRNYTDKLYGPLEEDDA